MNIRKGKLNFTVKLKIMLSKWFPDFFKNDDNYYVRSAVAENPLSSINTLEVLSHDEFWEIRQSVAQNPSAYYPTLDRLSKDKDELVRLGVARNPKTARVWEVDILVRLLKDDSKMIKDAVILTHGERLCMNLDMDLENIVKTYYK